MASLACHWWDVTRSNSCSDVYLLSLWSQLTPSLGLLRTDDAHCVLAPTVNNSFIAAVKPAEIFIYILRNYPSVKNLRSLLCAGDISGRYLCSFVPDICVFSIPSYQCRIDCICRRTKYLPYMVLLHMYFILSSHIRWFRLNIYSNSNLNWVLRFGYLQHILLYTHTSISCPHFSTWSWLLYNLIWTFLNECQTTVKSYYIYLYFHSILTIHMLIWYSSYSGRNRKICVKQEIAV